MRSRSEIGKIPCSVGSNQKNNFMIRHSQFVFGTLRFGRMVIFQVDHSHLLCSETRNTASPRYFKIEPVQHELFLPLEGVLQMRCEQRF